VVVLAVVIAASQLASCDSEDRLLPPGERVDVVLDRVVDGDTARFIIDGRSESVRYIGIDTPEVSGPGSPECYGEEATRFNVSRLAGGSIQLEGDQEERDRYGRLLAYVYVDGGLLNAEILERGYGETLTIPPNDYLSSEFERLADDAESNRRGKWSTCELISES
jgi:micrococcal nuclease